MSKTYRLTRIHDPGHSWLVVPIELLREVGAEDAISPYSYRTAAKAFLEEDVDMGTFLTAAQFANVGYIIVDQMLDEEWTGKHYHDNFNTHGWRDARAKIIQRRLGPTLDESMSRKVN